VRRGRRSVAATTAYSNLSRALSLLALLRTVFWYLGGDVHERIWLSKRAAQCECPDTMKKIVDTLCEPPRSRSAVVHSLCADVCPLRFGAIALPEASGLSSLQPLAVWSCAGEHWELSKASWKATVEAHGCSGGLRAFPRKGGLVATLLLLHARVAV
jgi:hypothetical protein